MGRVTHFLHHRRLRLSGMVSMVSGRSVVTSGHRCSSVSRRYYDTTVNKVNANSLSEKGRASVSRAIFNSYRNPETNTVHVGRLLAEMRRSGILSSDRRLRSLMLGLREMQREIGSIETTPESLEYKKNQPSTYISFGNN